jgi:hypothetical protein
MNDELEDRITELEAIIFHMIKDVVALQDAVDELRLENVKLRAKDKELEGKILILAGPQKAMLKRQDELLKVLSRNPEPKTMEELRVRDRVRAIYKRRNKDG